MTGASRLRALSNSEGRRASAACGLVPGEPASAAAARSCAKVHRSSRTSDEAPCSLWSPPAEAPPSGECGSSRTCAPARRERSRLKGGRSRQARHAQPRAARAAHLHHQRRGGAVGAPGVEGAVCGVRRLGSFKVELRNEVVSAARGLCWQRARGCHAGAACSQGTRPAVRWSRGRAARCARLSHAVRRLD